MNIQTAFLGELEIDDSQTITFEHGLPGFEEEHKFALLHLDEDAVYQVLQSVQTPHVAFVAVNPFVFTEYSFDLDETTVHSLSISSEEDVAVLSIVTVKEPFSQSTLNLKAPIVINTSSNKAKQTILEKSNFPLRHPISVKKG